MLIAAIVVLSLVVVFLLGPRPKVETTVTFDPASIGADVEAYLAAAEARVPGIRPGLQKEIVWADPAAKARTPLAVIYVHGFSASKGEIRPLPDEVAAALGANLFYTRLTGHGQDGAAMATASVQAWLNDFAEALAVGRAVGDRVVVIATSTGASIATWAAVRSEPSSDVAAMVLISPNYGLLAAGSGLLAMPWGAQVARLVIGSERSFEPLNARHAALWTTRYPTGALIPLAAMTRLAYAAPVETSRIPALFVFSGKDRVVSADLTRKVASRWGAPHQLFEVEDAGDPSGHVLAGDALSPATTHELAGRIVRWIDRTVAR